MKVKVLKLEKQGLKTFAVLLFESGEQKKVCLMGHAVEGKVYTLSMEGGVFPTLKEAKDA